MTRSYLVKWDGGQMMFSNEQSAIKKKNETNGKIFIADGKNTKSLDGIDVHHLNDEDEEKSENS